MKSLLSILLFALLLVSCDQEPDVKKLRQVLGETKYDSNVIKNIAVYDSLKNIIVSNIDTIFKFRNSRHFVYYSNANGNIEKIQENANSYKFYYNYGESTALSYGTGPNNQKLIDEVSVENMPAFIYPSVDKIFKKLGKNLISGFILSSDSTIEISVRSFRKDEIDVGHNLTWKRRLAKMPDHEYFDRDTVIAPKWTYEIWVDQRMGW